jgi:hypothetical protein
VRHFNKYKTKAAIKEVRAYVQLSVIFVSFLFSWRTHANRFFSLVYSIFDEHKDLTSFEQTSLINMCPSSVEEAKELIPSLRAHPDEKLQPIIDSLEDFRNFVV